MAKLSTIIAGFRENGRMWLRRGMAVLVLAFLFLVAGGGVSHHNKWRIDHVEISGAQTVDRVAVERFVREKLKGNYYFVYARENSRIFPTREIEGGLLETFPRLLSAKAERVDDHTIEVAVSERKPYALWCGAVYSPIPHALADCFFIGDTGFVFDRAPTFSPGVYLEVYSELLGANEEGMLRAQVSQSRFALLYAVTHALAREVGEPLRVVLKPEGEVAVTIKQSDTYPMLAGVEIRFKDSANVDTLMKNLVVALPVQFPSSTPLKKQPTYIDMRYGNKIFFGFEN